MFFLNAIVKNIAPLFIATSPITSYADQIYSIHKTRSSAGFSLDIPLIMLVASILKIFYWFGAHFSTSLLIQALLTILVQILLLHVALTNRVLPAHSHQPFQHALAPTPRRRPYDFWQWRSTRPYWAFVTYLTAGLLVLHLLLSTTRLFVPYTDLLGMVALAIEATLPLPQLLANWQRRGCKGFRPSVIANWVVGDTFKMWFFFASAAGEVPWAFKACGVFQATCDAGLAVQYLVWGDGPEGVSGIGKEKELRSPPPERDGFASEKMGDGAGTVGIEMGKVPAYERR
ncbi:uncharacterized protein EKO05_0010161 [Ascochyta rabiei]|uniref:Uncharacterized protein n=1 Tax=Didymella rabiei TaxID=5454 RepID=A0A162WP89_DIDRA|nr:uncharacterized protein EKO05_0010161 [Ascochyta rabiei]KZM19140.1 hypothetical protein ST47_g9708 [Ascochyta rabiei]UPX19912.1 hypothetical protein EKO05_0010161 [Ascochyta rabiei]